MPFDDLRLLSCSTFYCRKFGQWSHDLRKDHESLFEGWISMCLKYVVVLGVLTSLAKFVFVPASRNIVDYLCVPPGSWMEAQGREPDASVSTQLWVGHSRRPWRPGLVTNSILVCWLFKIMDRCKKVRFLQTQNQGLRQLLLKVSWDLRGTPDCVLVSL